MPHGSTLTAPLHGESTVVVKGVLRVGGTSFAADERRFSRLRLDHGLPGTIDGSFSLEVNASDDFVTSSRVRLRPCSQNTRSCSRSSTASRLALIGCSETSGRCESDDLIPQPLGSVMLVISNLAV